MEASYATVVISLACVVVGVLTWRALNWIWLRPKRLEKCLKHQGFKGNSYRLFFGDTKDRDRMLVEAQSKPMPQLSHDYLQRVLPFVHHTVKKYGKRCVIWNGPEPMVMISEPELIRQVFMRMDEFQKPKANPFILKIATGLVMLEGEEWAHRRKLINPAFHMDKLKLMLPAFSASSNDMIKKWEAMTSNAGYCEVDVWSYLQQLSADVISRAAFGSSYEEGRRIFELISEQIFVAIPVINAVYIPGWRFVPTKANRKIMQIDREIQTLLKGIIQKRKKAINNGEKAKDDLLGILLQPNIHENHDEHDKNHGLTLEEVINECKIFYMAGRGPTSVLLTWALILLGKHQDWQARAREEVLAMFGKSNPNFQGLNHLKIMNMILQEVLRLYPAVTQLTRMVHKEIKVGDICLPAGVMVNLPILLVQQDEKLWGANAKEFNPERFNKGISKATEGNMSFFSFGWGPRICIGSNFAMLEAKMALTLILQCFSFELSPSYTHAPSGLGTLQPQFGAYIILHPL